MNLKDQTENVNEKLKRDRRSMQDGHNWTKREGLVDQWNNTKSSVSEASKSSQWLKQITYPAPLKKKIDCENVKDKEKILEASIGKSSSSTKEPEPKAIRVFTSYSRFQVSTWNFVATPLIKSEDPLQGFKTCRSFRNALVFIFYEQLFEKCAVAIEEKPRDLSCSWLCP